MNQRGYNEHELSSIYNQLKSKNSHQQEVAAKSLAIFIHRNRNCGDDLLKTISSLLKPSSEQISDSVLIKVIHNVLKVLKDNNTQIINFLNMIFPLLFHIVFYLNRTIEEFEQITKMIGHLLNVGGNHLSQVIESNVGSLFERFSNPSFKFEYTRFASLSLLKEFTKSSPVIVFNKIIEKFDDFLKIIDNYKDPKECIREATRDVLSEFFSLLNNRDMKIKENFTKQIFSKLEKNFESTNENYIHGIILLLKTFSYNKDFFIDVHSRIVNFLHKHRSSKHTFLRVSVIEFIPTLAQVLEEKFENLYLNSFLEHLLNSLSNKMSYEVKSCIYLTFGKLSLIISKEKYTEYVHKIVKTIKTDLERKDKVCLSVFTCLAKLLINFPNIVLCNINYEEVLVTMFSMGFLESQCLFLEKLLDCYEKKSKPRLNILMSVLYVIAIIISENKFHCNDALVHLKNLENESNKKDNEYTTNTNNTTQTPSSVNTLVSSHKETTSISKKERKLSLSSRSIVNKNFINECRRAINNFILQKVSSNKVDSYNLGSIMIQNALQFLKIIDHEFFLKDILTFYQENCLKYLIDPLTAKKETAFSLANAVWIPDYRENSLDNDQEFKLNIIVDAYLNVLLNDASDETKIKLLNLLDARYHKILASNNFFEKITLVLNFDDNTLKEKVVELIGNLLEYNFTTIIVFIKKSILEIFNKILLSIDKSDKEESVLLLSFFVKYTGKHILDYVEMIFSQLISVLKQSVNDENDILNISILIIVSELIVHNKKRENMKISYFKNVMEVCIENLKDNSNTNKQEISLKTVLSILEYSGYKFNIYFDYPKLVNELIELLTKDSNIESRNLALRIFGNIGAMDNETLEKIWSVHKIETTFLNENYEVDEYNNIDNQDIIDHQRKKIKYEMEGIYKNNLKKNSSEKKVDIDKILTEQEIDPCTYYAVRSLVNILNEENMETGVHVIQFLGSLIKSLQDNETYIVEMILNTLINRIQDYDSNLVKAIFDIFMIILKNFKTAFKNHLKEVLEQIEYFIGKPEFQIVAMSLLVKIFDSFNSEMKNFFPHWIPKLVYIMVENMNPNFKDKNKAINKHIFQCFILSASNLGNYLGLIIPDIIKLLCLPPDNTLFYEKSAIKVTKQQSQNSYFIHPSLIKEQEIPLHIDEFSQEDIINFLENILTLPSVTQFLPKIVMGLLKFMESHSMNTTIVERVMKLFIRMAGILKKNFIFFLPSIIRSTKHLNIPHSIFFGKMKLYIDQENFSNHIKLRSMSDPESSTRYSNYNDINNFDRSESYMYEKYEREGLKTRKNQMEKDLLVKEFDPSHCSIEEDWKEWFKSSVKSLFGQSPSYAIYYCYNVLDYYLPLHTELYNYAFISCWRNLNDHQKFEIINGLEQALTSNKTPKEILLTILNLSEYIEREENTEFINYRRLGEVAIKCKAYAKALYYMENDYRSNSDYETLESLINLYYNLKLPEAAYGILKMNKDLSSNKGINDDDWYIKLHRWNNALNIINKKLEKDFNNPEYLNSKFKCLEGLCDWESLINLSDDIEEINNKILLDNMVSDKLPIENQVSETSNNNSISPNNSLKSPIHKNSLNINNNNKLSKHVDLISIDDINVRLTRASMNLGDWGKVKTYIAKIPDSTLDEDTLYEKNFLSAIIHIQEKNYDQALESIKDSRYQINIKIKTLLSESYERAYSLLLENQNLYELEELISYKVGNSDISREKLKSNWKSRLENITEEVRGYERILAIRSLVFDISEDYENHLDLAEICLREDRFSACLNILNRLKKKLGEDDSEIKLRVELKINKCLYQNNQQKEAIKNLEVLMQKQDLSNINENTKSKLYSTLGSCKVAELENNKISMVNQISKVKEVLKILENGFKYNKKNYKAWHFYGLLNFRYFEEVYVNSNLEDNDLDMNINSNASQDNMNDFNISKDNHIDFAKNAVIAFINAVNIGGTNIARTLQDLLRIIEIWFLVGSHSSISKEIYKAIENIEPEAWMLVIPQLLARINIIDENIKAMLSYLFKIIFDSHPRALIYPLAVFASSKNAKRRSAAREFFSHIKKKNKLLTDECCLIINELNRCALLLHEEWAEAIEESANLYFKKNDVDGMINILMNVHDKMKTPVTLNEIHFHQLYAADLLEAKEFLQKYLNTENDMDLKQSWDIYHSIYKSIDEVYQKINYLDLENISPKLFNFTESEIDIPGMYKSGYPFVKIKSFDSCLTVLNSKQHPRKMIIYGSEGKEYNFLLKGHEDLRQDESAMQLFSLVNTLLANDQDTSSKNLFIKRFPIVPLSHNTGLIGWVSNCDTLHQLIKEYRTSNNIIQDVEKRLILGMCSKFETCTFLNKLEVFKYALRNTLGIDLYKILWKKSKNSEVWLDRRTNYSRSLAVMSMVGYILGLGDRHPSNLMLDKLSGKIIHIDFGDCFEVAMKRDKFPEKVPFRLTRMLLKGLEVSGIEGTFRLTCENVMRVLRDNKHSLLAILAAFLHNPLVSFRLQIPAIIKAQKNKTFIIPHEERTSESLKREKIEDLIIREQGKQNNKNNNHQKSKSNNLEKNNSNSKLFKNETQFNFNNDDDDGINNGRRKMESNERHLFNRFEERDEIESEELNRIAKIVIGRIKDKLRGTDFSKEALDVQSQVDKLIKQATSHENLCQNYIGWCPYW